MQRIATTVFTSHLLVWFLLIGFVSTLPAIEQLTEPQCEQLQQELDKVRAEQRRGMKIRRANQLADLQQHLEQQLFFYCDKPTQVQPSAQRTTKRRLPAHPAVTTSPRLFPQAMSSVVEIKAPFQGAKLTAWLAFYQEPRFCFGVRQTSVLVECVHLRQQALAQFERHWQQHPRKHDLSDQ